MFLQLGRKFGIFAVYEVNIQFFFYIPAMNNWVQFFLKNSIIYITPRTLNDEI